MSLVKQSDTETKQLEVFSFSNLMYFRIRNNEWLEFRSVISLTYDWMVRKWACTEICRGLFASTNGLLNPCC